MRLLITGIPGTGKTSIGDYLQEALGYEHFDVESANKLGQLEQLVTFINSPGDNKVITWGFYPGLDDQNIRNLQAAGFQMIWFDGNREAALKYFLKRGDVPEEAFRAQIERIDALDLESFKPRVFNTFDDMGRFLSKELIAELLTAAE